LSRWPRFFPLSSQSHVRVYYMRSVECCVLCSFIVRTCMPDGPRYSICTSLRSSLHADCFIKYVQEAFVFRFFSRSFVLPYITTIFRQRIHVFSSVFSCVLVVHACFRGSL